ncbi:MBL fold metallo-hydrolase [Actinomadura decatromicini]|uniref:MBL fold metallo-hydrolase n=1 Tax=Actinomadura decatromicini TaxID=2604572 RepID=UPI00319DDF85
MIVEVADRVFGYVQEPGGWCVSNAGLVAGPDGMLVIDTLATESRAGRLREAVDRRATGPGRTIVNTHSHGDHTFGNHRYGRGATIVAHAGARAEMAETGTALTGLWPEVEWGDVRVTLPTVTFEDRLTLHLGERRVELLSVAPAHTGHDVVVWLPEERVLFAGDVVMSGATPFCLFGSVPGTLAAIERLRALDPVTVVCGHGPIAGPEVFDANAAYLRWVQRLAADGRDAGLTPLEVATKADLGAYAGLLDAERLVGNLHRAYAEADGDTGSGSGTGAPGRLDLTEIFNEMVAYNGGRPLTCLA